MSPDRLAKFADIGTEVMDVEYGIFISDPDPKQSFWLESSRLLSYYHLYDGIDVEYKSKLRRLIISTMDGTRKTLQVDESKTIADLMLTICGKMGITNHEEYSLIHEKARMQTIRKGKSQLREYDRLEKLKQKLHTDDDLNWLSHSKTLRQHGIEETDNLLLQRKYFFSDQNVDARDPVQLNLLYLQLKKAILDGAHPISFEQAVELAGLQCQAELGNMVPEKAKSTTIDLKEHVPKEYVKVKGIEKRIKESHQKLNGLQEKDAKIRYIQLCRSLPTYGITFFLIKEKLTGRNKLVPRLFGVSKESVMRVDEKTKEILETWPLTRVRRWAATANLFTLDFGEYSPDGNYVMQTTEGEQIAQLISGYIDIILRRQKKCDTTGYEENDSTAIFEENIGPSRAEIVSSSGTMSRGHKVAGGYLAYDGYVGHAVGTYTGTTASNEGDNVSDRYLGNSGTPMRAQLVERCANGVKRRGGSGVQMVELRQPKRAVVSRIDSNSKEIKSASESLNKPYFENSETVQRNDLATQRWRLENMAQARAGISSHLGAMTIATGNLLTVLQSNQFPVDEDESQPELDYAAVDSSLTTIGLNVQRLMQNVRVLDQLQAAEAGLSSDATSGSRQGVPCSPLTAAAQEVAAAFLSLMESASPVRDEQKGEEAPTIDRPSLFEAASKVGDASQQLLQLVSTNQLQCHRLRHQFLEPIPEDENENEPGEPDYEVETGNFMATAHALDWQLRDNLLSATKEVANATANLVKFAKAAAVAVNQQAAELMNTETDSEELAADRDRHVDFLRDAQTQLIQDATHAGKATSRLVTCAKVVVCTMEQPASQRQMLSCAQEVSQAVNALVDVAAAVAEAPPLALQTREQRVEQAAAFDGLRHATTYVNACLDQLTKRLMSASVQAQQDPLVMSLLESEHQIPAALGDGEALLRQAEHLAQTTSALIEELRTNQDLLAAANVSGAEAAIRADFLAADVSRLIDAMKLLAEGNQQSLPYQQKVVAASSELLERAQALAAPIIRARLTTGLEFATRLTATNASLLGTMTEEAVRVSRSSQFKILQELDTLQNEVMPEVTLSCDQARAQPQEFGNQTNLLAASKNLMDTLKDFISSVDILAPTVPDTGIQAALTSAARNTHICLTDLRQCCSAAEPVLKNPPPPLPTFDAETAKALRRGSKTTPSVRVAWPSIASRLADMHTQLNSNSDHKLPGDTLDSVCAAVINSVAKFNDAFPPASTSHTSSLPERLVTEAKEISEGSGAGLSPDQLPPVTAKLLDSLRCVTEAVRGLAGYLSSILDETAVDPDLNNVLIASWNLLDHEVTDEGQRLRPSSQVFNAEFAASELKKRLLENGNACLTNAHSCLLWALHDSNIEDFNFEHVINEHAGQLVASISDLRKLVPGSQLAYKLNSIVDQLPSGAESKAKQNGHSSPISSERTDTEPTDPRLLLTALRGLVEASEDTGRLTAEQSGYRRDENGFSSTCNLAMAADRLANALSKVLDAFGTLQEPDKSTDPALGDLQKAARPLAKELQKALSGEGVGSSQGTTFNAVRISQLCFQLRDWALQTTEQTQNRMAKELAITGESATPAAVERQLENARAQLTSALEALSIPSKHTRSSESEACESEFPLITYPVSKMTYPECAIEACELEQSMTDYLESIPTHAKSKNSQAFCAAVQGVADAALGMLQVATQSAYLVGASQPCNAPGHAPRLSEQDARRLTEVTEAMCVDLDKLSYEAAAFGSDPIDNDKIIQIANDITMDSSHICQAARQCISESTDSAVKKVLAENAKEVAQLTTQLVNLIHGEDSRSARGADVVRLSDALKNSVHRLAGSLLQDISDSPIQVMSEAASYQTPLLSHGRRVVYTAGELTDCACLLLNSSEAETAYLERRQALQSAAASLRECIGAQKPGIHSLEALRSAARSLLRRLDDVGLRSQVQNGDGSSELDTSVPLINSSLHQMAALSGKLAGDWRQERWELVANDANQMLSYLPSLVNEVIKAMAGLNRSSDQAQLQGCLRTVLEATDVLSQNLLTRIHKYTDEDKQDTEAPISEHADQLRQACRDLLNCMDELSMRQGSLNSQVAAIHAACAKLDEAPTSPSTPDQQHQLVPLQTRLANQARGITQLGNRLTEAAKAAAAGMPGAMETEENAAASLVKEFSRAVDTTRQFSTLLASQRRNRPVREGDQSNEQELGSRLADRLRVAMQGIGKTCVDLLHHPNQTDGLHALTGRVSSLIAVLQQSSRGVYACASAAEGISNVVADFDSAIYFARANSLVDPDSAGSGQSTADVISSESKIQQSQEKVMHLAKGIIEETNALSQNLSGEQDSLAISAQNCLLHVKNLHSATLGMVTQTDVGVNGAALQNGDLDAKTEARVNLLSAARAVSASLIDLLSQSRALATAGDDPAAGANNTAMQSSSIRIQLNNTAKEVVTRVSELRLALRYFNEIMCPIKAPSPASPVHKLSSGTVKVRVPANPPKPASTTEVETSATGSVRAGLQSVLATVNKLRSHLEEWSPDTGLFKSGDDMDSEREIASGDMTTPSQINQAALGITQAALKANSATGSARKLVDMSIAGEVIHQAATELVKRIRCGTRAAMLKTSNQRKQSTVSASGEVQSSADGADYEFDRQRCVEACTRTIEGGKTTLTELAVMLEHMIRSLDDSATGQSPSMQVTLAMRRLRETVYEIVEGAKQMSGGSQSFDSPTSSPKVSAWKPALPARPASRVAASVSSPSKQTMETNILSTRSQLAESIAKAEEIATDVGDAAGTQELRGFTSEIENSVQKLVQLQSRTANHTNEGGRQQPSPIKLGVSAEAQLAVPATEEEVQKEVYGDGIDAILAACRHLAHATANLMHWAAAAQRELVQKGRLKPISEVPLENAAESQWTYGLVSAARYVSAATNHLVESAQTLAAVHSGCAENPQQQQQQQQQEAPLRFAPEGLIAAARTVVSYTGQLVFACVAKADASSTSMCGLNSAASAVRKYAECVVQLAQGIANSRPTEAPVAGEPAGSNLIGSRRGTVQTMRQVIETKSSIAHKMAELERLQNRLKSINQESYRSQTDINDL
ncbi:Talin-1 [Sparganum proliferum]